MCARFLIVGDVHFSFSNETETECLYREIRDQTPLDGCILLGDVLNSPEGQDSAKLVANKLLPWLRKIAALCPLHIVLGNHDMYGAVRRASERRRDDSPLVSILETDNNITVYWQPKVQTLGRLRVLFMPYIHSMDMWEETVAKYEASLDVIFSHADMGDDNPVCRPYKFRPLCFNGHIHKPTIQGKLVNLGEAFIHQFLGAPYRTRHALLTDDLSYTLVPTTQPILYRPDFEGKQPKDIACDIDKALRLGVKIVYEPRFVSQDQASFKKAYSEARATYKDNDMLEFRTCAVRNCVAALPVVESRTQANTHLKAKFEEAANRCWETGLALQAELDTDEWVHWGQVRKELRFEGRTDTNKRTPELSPPPPRKKKRTLGL